MRLRVVIKYKKLAITIPIPYLALHFILLLSLAYVPLAIATFQGRIANTRTVWPIASHFYGEYVSSEGDYELTQGSIRLGDLNSTQPSSVTWKIEAFLHPFMNEELKRQTTVHLLIAEDTPKSRIKSIWQLQNDKAPTGKTYALYPLSPGYTTFIGKYFPSEAKGFIENLLVYAINSDAKDHVIHIRFSPAPGEPVILEKSLIVPAKTDGWVETEINEMWNYDSIFPHIYMDPQPNAGPGEYSPKIAYTESEGKPDAYITIASPDSWQPEDQRYLIRLNLKSAKTTPHVLITFNNHAVLDLPLYYDCEKNLSTLSFYEMSYKYHYLQTLMIPLNFSLVRENNLLNITISPYTCWDITYINLWFDTKITDTNPFWLSLMPYHYVFVIFGVEIIVATLLLKRLTRWLKKLTRD